MLRQNPPHEPSGQAQWRLRTHHSCEEWKPIAHRRRLVVATIENASWATFDCEGSRVRHILDMEEGVDAGPSSNKRNASPAQIADERAVVGKISALTVETAVAQRHALDVRQRSSVLLELTNSLQCSSQLLRRTRIKGVGFILHGAARAGIWPAAEALRHVAARAGGARRRNKVLAAFRSQPVRHSEALVELSHVGI